MTLDTYAYDDSTLLNLCQIEILPAFRIFFPKPTLEAKNYSRIQAGLKQLAEKGNDPHRFVPGHPEEKIIEVAESLLTGYNIRILGPTFKACVIDQLDIFAKGLESNFKQIQKNENIAAVRNIFQNNQRVLKRKLPHVPEDDDCSIIAGYVIHPSTGRRVLVSFDEHFWGYSDLILTEFGITVVPEWDAHRVPL